MKFTKLNTKIHKLLKKKEAGKAIKQVKLQELLKLLDEKKLHYEKRLETDLSEEKRASIETKLKVVCAQIEKSRQLL